LGLRPAVFTFSINRSRSGVGSWIKAGRWLDHVEVESLASGDIVIHVIRGARENVPIHPPVET
jgi:hypothetical protein